MERVDWKAFIRHLSIILLTLAVLSLVILPHQYDLGYRNGLKAGRDRWAGNAEIGGIFSDLTEAQEAKVLLLRKQLQDFYIADLTSPLGGWTFQDETHDTDWQVRSLWDAAGATPFEGRGIADITSELVGEDRVTLVVRCHGQIWTISTASPDFQPRTQKVLAEIEKLHAEETLEMFVRLLGQHAPP